MAVNDIQKYSPRWLGDLLCTRLDRFYDTLAAGLERARWVHILNLGLFILLLAASHYLYSEANFFSPAPGEARNLLISRYIESLSSILLLCAFGTFAFYLSEPVLPTFGVLVFVIGGSSLYFFDRGHYYGNELSLTINFIVSFSFFFLFYWLRNRYSARALKWDFVVAAYLALAASYVLDYKFSFNLIWYFEVPRLMFIFGLLSVEFGARRNAPMRQEFAYIFSPMNLLTPIPVEAKDRHYDSSWKVRVRGLGDILTSLFFLALALKFKRLFLRIPTDPNTLDFLLYGLKNYFYYFLGSFAWIGLPVGIGRWFGMNLPSYFELPLLATSPADRWRRWNTYYYHWFYKIIFFPVFKKTKSLVAAIVGVTLCTIIVHAGSFNYGLFLAETDLLRTRTFMLVFTFFSLHSVLIYLAIKFPRLWPSEKKRTGWIGVIVMTFLMTLVHIIAPK